jgi:organic hydroperoxide reductase OsmC/OhrA
MANQHSYATSVRWTGNRGTGTSSYRDYGREHEVSAGDRPMLLGSSDAAFRGDAGRWSPEDLLVVALSQCHMLAYLHLCAVNGGWCSPTPTRRPAACAPTTQPASSPR